MIFVYCLIVSFLLKLQFSYGFLAFFTLTVALFWLTRFILFRVFDIEIASASDMGTNIETPVNAAYIVSCCTIEDGLDIPYILSKIKERAFIHPCYNKLKKIYKTRFGVCFWQPVPKFFLDEHIEIIDKKFSSYDEVYEFMTHHVAHDPFPKDIPNWKIFILPNMPDNYGGLMMKIHHGLADGLSLMSYLLMLGESKKYEQVKIPKIRSWQWIMIYVLGFFEMIKFIKKLNAKKPDNNRFRQIKLSGKKNCYKSDSFDLNTLKTYAKTLDVSINDVLLALMAKSLRNYHIKKFNEDLDEFAIMIAASLVPMPKNNEIHPLGNNVNVLIESLYFDNPNDSFADYVKKCHKVFKHLKSSYVIYFQQLASEFSYLFMTPGMLKKSLDQLTGVHSAVYTSVPGPTTAISLFGHDVKDLFFFVTANAEAALLFNVLTYNNRFSFAGMADNATGVDCKVLIKEFERLLMENVGVMK